MSDTLSVEAVGSSYWTFMATVMAARLDNFINSGEVTPSEIPRGVYDDALEYFELVMGAAKSTLPEDPPASINAYVTAIDALRGSLKPFPETNEDLVAKLDRYAAFVNGLDTPHQLTDAAEVETARSLRDFFRSLAQDGEAEMYVRTIRTDNPANGYHFI